MDELDNLILKLLNKIFTKLEFNIEENKDDIWREIEDSLNKL